MLIIIMTAFVGGLCLVAGATGLLAGSAELLEVVLNLVVGLLTVIGVLCSFLFKRRQR